MAAHWGTLTVLLSTWLLLIFQSCAHGREVQIPGTEEREVPRVSGGDCPFQVDATFPSRVKVHMKVDSGSSAQLVTDGIKSRSMSPWEYSSNVDNNRFPVVISEAGCLDAQGNVDLSMNLVPIRQEILVLHREMEGCVPVYKLGKQLVTVGCTCVRPIIQYLK